MSEESTIIATNESIFIDSLDAISDAIGKCFSATATALLLTESDVSPEFFNLRSGLAGELFQKFTNYRIKLAIVVKDFGLYGERVSELIFEHTNHSSIRFFDSDVAAKAWLSA